MPPCLVSPLRARNELLAYIGRHPESQLAIVSLKSSYCGPYSLHSIVQARGIAAGTEYLHSNMVVHGDIKAVSMILLFPKVIADILV